MLNINLRTDKKAGSFWKENIMIFYKTVALLLRLVQFSLGILPNVKKVCNCLLRFWAHDVSVLWWEIVQSMYRR